MRPGLLGKDRIRRIARPDRVEDQRLGQVIRLGHDVPGTLVVDLLEPLVAVHQDGPGLLGEVQGERKFVGEDRAVVRAGRHGDLHSARSGTTWPPSVVIR